MCPTAGATESPGTINEYLKLADELNPRGDDSGWQALKYYRISITGYRAGETVSEGRIYDVYATFGSDRLRALAGVRSMIGTWVLTSKNLSAVELLPAGELRFQTSDFTSVFPETELDAPTDRSIVTHSYTDDEITTAIYQSEEDWKAEWAFEFEI